MHLPSLALSALQLTVAQAVAAGAQGCECAVIITEAEDPAMDPGIAALQDYAGAGVPILVCDMTGSVTATLATGAGH